MCIYACIHVYIHIYIYIYIFPKGDCQLMSPCYCSAPCTWRNSVPWDLSQIFRLPSFRHSFQMFSDGTTRWMRWSHRCCSCGWWVEIFFLAIDGWLYEIYWFNKSMGFHGKTCFFQWPPYFVETFFCCVTRYFWKPNSWKLGTRWFWFGAVWQLTHYPRILKRYGTPYALQHKIR